jgi:predicted lipid-binding transport protein (Tim44 family)
MPDYWGDSNKAANSTAPEPPPAADSRARTSSGKGEEANAETPSLSESFVHGLAKGAATGFVVGFDFGALVATSGTAALLLGVIKVGMIAVQAGEIIVSKDMHGRTLLHNERVKIVGELVGGVIGGGYR